MPARKPNQYLIDEELNICRITTSLTKSLNRDLKLWKTESIDNIQIHDFEVIVDYDEYLIRMLKENYLIFYNSANDIRHAKRKNPRPVSNDSYNGYFWGWNIHTKKRYPLGRIIWEYCYGRRGLLDSQVIDHNSDVHNLCIISNLTPMSQTQNKAKLKYHRRFCGDYSIVMASHPNNRNIHILRFKDNAKREQHLLVYNTEPGLDLLLDDLNSFKTVSLGDTDRFMDNFDEVKKNGCYSIYDIQPITGDKFVDDLFHVSIN